MEKGGCTLDEMIVSLPKKESFSYAMVSMILRRLGCPSK